MSISRVRLEHGISSWEKAQWINDPETLAHMNIISRSVCDPATCCLIFWLSQLAYFVLWKSVQTQTQFFFPLIYYYCLVITYCYCLKYISSVLQCVKATTKKMTYISQMIIWSYVTMWVICEKHMMVHFNILFPGITYVYVKCL